MQVLDQGPVITSLVTGAGDYRIRLGLPARYDQFSVTVSEGVQVEGMRARTGEFR